VLAGEAPPPKKNEKTSTVQPPCSTNTGFNVETVEYKNISFTVWDVGGQDKARFLVFLAARALGGSSGRERVLLLLQ
jgi:GTPase SAR1 family protein